MDNTDNLLQENEPFFGSWHITEKLDQGSSGQLYQIHKRDAMGNDFYSAMKVISIPSSGENEVKSLLSTGLDEEDLEDYYQSVIDSASNEFTILSRLKGNTNIVSYEDHEIIRHKDSFGWDIRIRMEQITPLLDYSLDHEITEEQVFKMGMDICHGLALCARHDIIHRDIKPANIFVSENGDYKIGDFGIARIAAQTQTYLSRKGTFTYMAPEVFRGDSYTENVDVYSLGLVMYQYLNNGRAPFVPEYPKPIVYSDNEKALAKRMSGLEIPEPANGSPRLKEIVMKACAFESSERYATAQDMLEDLEELQEEGKQVMRREKKISKLPRYKRRLYRFWARKKKALIAAVAAILLCTVFCVAMFLRGVTGIEGPANDTKLLIGDSDAPEYVIKPFWFRNSAISFSSSDEKVFTVDDRGKIMATGIGEAVLTMKCRSYTRYAMIQVDPKVTDIENISDLELYTGSSKKLKPSLQPEKYADEKISYSSADDSVAKVSSKGKITAKKKGSTTITIAAGGTAKTLHVTVSEKPAPVETAGSGAAQGSGGSTTIASNSGGAAGSGASGASGSSGSYNGSGSYGSGSSGSSGSYGSGSSGSSKSSGSSGSRSKSGSSKSSGSSGSKSKSSVSKSKSGSKSDKSGKSSGKDYFSDEEYF